MLPSGRLTEQITATTSTSSTDTLTTPDSVETTQTTESITSTEATDLETNELAITASNWQNHPDVVNTLMMYTELNEFIEVGLLRQKLQSFETCDAYQELSRTLWSDRGTIRRYISSYGGEENTAIVEHTYDTNGMLRFVHISESTTPTESTIEHKIYYTEDGNLLWHDKTIMAEDDSDLAESKIIETVTFNPELAFDANHLCD